MQLLRAGENSKLCSCSFPACLKYALNTEDVDLERGPLGQPKRLESLVLSLE